MGHGGAATGNLEAEPPVERHGAAVLLDHDQAHVGEALSASVARRSVASIAVQIATPLALECYPKPDRLEKIWRGPTTFDLILVHPRPNHVSRSKTASISGSAGSVNPNTSWSTCRISAVPASLRCSLGPPRWCRANSVLNNA